ncbi:hypothetical protein C8F04DRAFT_881147, partial [Mycena alexandri]
DIATLKCVLAPVRRVPPEILVEIFNLCIEDIRFLNLRYSLDDPRVAPVVLTHVCATWREV